MILYCIFRLFNVVLKFYSIFLGLLNVTVMKILWAPMKTSLRAEWATLCE